MAINATYAAPRQGVFVPQSVAEAAFVAVLLLVFVGVDPFAAKASMVAVGAGSSGDSLRQVLYLLLFAVEVTIALQRRSLALITSVPPVLALLLAWCFLSAGWSLAPAVTIRRSALCLILASSTLMAVDSVGPERALALLRQVLIGILAVNWLSIYTIPAARHLPGDPEPALVGDWRGLFVHKNIAGAVTGLTAIFIADRIAERRRWQDLLLFALAVGFLIGTRSKTSLGLLPLALALGALYRWGWRSDLDRLIAALLVLLAATTICLYAAAHLGAIERVLEDPQALTGRSVIWQAEIGYIADHPLLGAGFGSFADTGMRSPLANYINAAWLREVWHGHSGYLQTLVVLGSVGLALMMTEFLLLPLWRFWPRAADPVQRQKALLFTLFMFMLLHNVLESDFITDDGQLWTVLLIATGSLRRLSGRASP